MAFGAITPADVILVSLSHFKHKDAFDREACLLAFAVFIATKCV